MGPLKTGKASTVNDSACQAILLLNCRSCDDILRMDEEFQRPCMCGKSTARFVSGKWMVSGPTRMISISFEQYDGAAPGLSRTWMVLP